MILNTGSVFYIVKLFLYKVAPTSSILTFSYFSIFNSLFFHNSCNQISTSFKYHFISYINKHPFNKVTNIFIEACKQRVSSTMLTYILIGLILIYKSYNQLNVRQFCLFLWIHRCCLCPYLRQPWSCLRIS